MRATTLLLVVGLLSACSVQLPRADGPDAPPTDEPAVEAPAPRPDVAPDDRSDDEGQEDAETLATACEPGDVDAMDDQVAGQLEAIAEQDWSGALAFATSDFRADYDDRRFAQVITDGFPVVAENASHSSEGCVRADDEAQLLVTVTASDGATADLVYLMGLEDGTWRIGGAVPHGAGSDDEPDTQVV